MQPGRYRLGFALADAAGTRLRMDHCELLVG
jgi:hypothetical protein